MIKLIVFLFTANILFSGNLKAQNVPGDNFDLSAWKLQTLKESDSSFVEVNPINTHTSRFFYTNYTDNAMAFSVPSNGEPTSGNTGYARVELRQISDGANWSLSDVDTHYLSAKCRVIEVSEVKPKTIIGQIHGSESNSEMLKIRWTGYLAGQCYVEARFQTNDDAGSEYGVTLASGLSLGDTVNYSVSMARGKVEVTINGNTESQTYTSQYYGTTDKYYFKAGNYIQWNESIVGTTIVSGKNLFYELSLDKPIIQELKPDPESTYISSTNKNDLLPIYPNPASDYVILNTDLLIQPDAVIELIDSKARIIKRIKVIPNQLSNGNSYQIDLNDLNTGVYFIRVISGSLIENRKLLISK